MNPFIQLHLLTSYPPANLNRDDLGRPKTAVMGGSQRLRISSQSLKRAWRTSEVFEEALGDHRGVRTKEMGVRVVKRLLEHGVAEKEARQWARTIAAVFGKLKKSKDEDGSEEALHIVQLMHFSPQEFAAVGALADRLAAEKRAPTEEDLKLLGDAHGAADVALFGRMLAADTGHNVDGAVQVAHALGVHKSAVEDDFFTAVDDLNDGQDDLGVGHMGEVEFGAGLFYLYLCLDRRQLLANLGQDEDLMKRTIAALVECAATVAPTGKQRTFGSRAYASYILAERGRRQPRSLSVAFLKPVDAYDNGMLANAIQALEQTRERMDAVYGACSDAPAIMSAHRGQGRSRGGRVPPRHRPAHPVGGIGPYRRRPRPGSAGRSSATGPGGWLRSGCAGGRDRNPLVGLPHRPGPWSRGPQAPARPHPPGRTARSPPEHHPLQPRVHL